MHNTWAFVFFIAVAIFIPRVTLGSALLSGNDLFTKRPLSIQLDKNQKALAVVFLSTTCPCSNSHFSHLKKLASRYPRIRVVGVHANKLVSQQSARQHYENLSPNFTVLHDPELKLADAFAAVKTPHAFLVAANGATLYQGGISNSSDFSRANKTHLQLAMTQISNEQPAQPSQTRALGCSIKR